MLLYHFTSVHSLRAIASHGITVGDVPTDLRRHRGRVGVWLTSSASPLGHGLSGVNSPKKRVRLSVDVADGDVVRWTDWAPANVRPETIANLVECAGKDGAPALETWFIHFKPVPASRIVGCIDMLTGSAISDWGDHSPAALDHKAVPPSRRLAWHNRAMKRYSRHVRGLERAGYQIAY